MTFLKRAPSYEAWTHSRLKAKGEINFMRKKKVSNTVIRDFLLHVLQTLQGLDFHQKVEIKSSPYIVQYHNQILSNKSID